MNTETEPTAEGMGNKGREKVRCPYCGYEMPVFMGKNAEAKDIYIRCKARHCKRIFEIRK